MITVSLDTPRVQSQHVAGAGHRADIEGLRALAIALVVVYHVWLGRVSGGVDVFLLLSTYLLSDSFIRRLEDAGAPRLRTFLTRRFARLLPAAAITISVTLVAAAVVLPASMWSQIWAQSWASLLYWQNWELMASSVDYYARVESIPSPLQHFWSLSIQGQVFVLWPVLLLGVGAMSARFGLRPRRVAAIVFGGIFLLSLIYSVLTTAVHQELAYFDTGARLWEFALGSLAAIVAPSLCVGRVTGRILGWLGLAGILSCGLVLDVGAGFPGFAALWPTLSAVALLIAGDASAPGPVSRWLSSEPLRRLGVLAYCLYLVHWPILVFVMAGTGETRIGIADGALVILASIVAAIALHYGVERGFRGRRGGSETKTLLAALLVVAVPLASWQGWERWRVLSVEPVANPGARVLLPWSTVDVKEGAELVPLGAALDAEWIGLDEPCGDSLAPAREEARITCTHQPASRAEAPTVLVIGDSHAGQWMGALEPLAVSNDWHLVSVLKGGCSLGYAEIAPGDTACREWQRATISYAEKLRPELVVMMGTKAEPEGPGERVPWGLARTVDRIGAVGSEVVVLRDNPRFEIDMFECVEQFGSESEQCRRDRASVLAMENPAERLARPGVHVVDLTEYLCPDGVCMPVIGNVAVYLDDNHLTGSYARSLARALADALVHIRVLSRTDAP